ncbi:MAG: holo-ACP synthase [Deltaproteobacteria bacterium]|nr:holo-ACP synthase [Deltaproteobacteria bacterium]
MIHGIGIDVVDVERFRFAMERWGGRLTRRLFTEKELDYCMRQRRPERHLAARFAAKVSLFKALGYALPFTEVEVERGGDGRPALSAPGMGKGLRPNLSISHEGALSLAETIVERDDEAR